MTEQPDQVPDRLRDRIIELRSKDRGGPENPPEPASPPTFYLPPEDVRTDLLEGSSRSTLCEWKEEARPQPGEFYGGWVTDEIVGPFKGEPGTEGW